MSFSTIMYHEIREAKDFDPEHRSFIDVKEGYEDILPSPLFVTLEHFEGQMAYLYDNKFHTLTLAEIKDYYQGENIPEKSILLTFDDCYQSVKRYAYPLLKKYGFHAVAFVVPSWLHDQPKEFNPEKSVCLTKEDLVEMEDVFEYANHTDTFHKRKNETTSMIMEASDEEFSCDLDKCNEFVQVKDVFAYPFGLFNERNIDLLRKKNFALAFTSKPGKNNRDTDPFYLHRNAVPYFMELEAFKNTVN